MNIGTTPTKIRKRFEVAKTKLPIFFFHDHFFKTMSLEDASELKKEDEKIQNDLGSPLSAETEKKPKKNRKPFEWTEKRKEAFDKMRAGLELKNEIALKLKLEKQKKEKEEIKKRVREIMNGHKKKEEEEASEQEDTASDEEEMVKPKKVKKSKKVTEKAPPKKEKKTRKAEKLPSSSEEESESEDEPSSEEEEKLVRSKKSVDRAQKTRVLTGKTQRTTQHYLNSDRFILL